MASKVLTLQARAAQVIARQKFVEDVLKFVTAVVYKRGVRLKQEIHSWHTYTECELKNFGGFSFYVEGTHSMYGGEMAKIWYHPGTVEPKAEHLVFEVYWQLVEKCDVRRFAPALEWQRAIRQLMRNEERVAKISETKKKREAAKARRAAARDEEYRRARVNLEQNAERLKLSFS